MLDYRFTSESVSEGHPDKIADQISDALLDAYLTQDPHTRLAAEVLLSRGIVVLAGEIASDGFVDHGEVVRQTIKKIGYDDPSSGFHYFNVGLVSLIQKQSLDIQQGVGRKNNPQMGAGDQGIMFGYAVRETPELMPLSITLAHTIVKRLSEMRKKTIVSWLRPDAKTQITLEYKNGRVAGIDTIVLSTQHAEEVQLEEINHWVKEYFLTPQNTPEICEHLRPSTKLLINPTGRFVVGGPMGDTGLTGRKIIVDTYGGHGAHGGGAFSGKDASKVDRSAAYAARHIAKNIVAGRGLHACLIQLSYAIGYREPIDIFIKTEPEITASDRQTILRIIRANWDLSPYGMISEFGLDQPIFSQTSTYGHFGKSELPWEKLNKKLLFS